MEDVVFSTYSGVDITITKATEHSDTKLDYAFDAYEDIDNDYQKLNNDIVVVWGDEANKPIVTWTDKQLGE